MSPIGQHHNSKLEQPLCVAKSVQTRLQRCQNKIIRYILDYEPRHHLTVKDFHKLKFLDVVSRVDYLSLNIMYNVYNETAPEYMCQYISKLVPSHNTRNSVNAFQIDRVGSHGVHTFKWNGVKLWNKLPNDVKCAKTKSDFKIQCKRCLMKKMVNDEMNEYTL